MLFRIVQCAVKLAANFGRRGPVLSSNTRASFTNRAQRRALVRIQVEFPNFQSSILHRSMSHSLILDRTFCSCRMLALLVSLRSASRPRAAHARRTRGRRRAVRLRCGMAVPSFGHLVSFIRVKLVYSSIPVLNRIAFLFECFIFCHSSPSIASVKSPLPRSAICTSISAPCMKKSGPTRAISVRTAAHSRATCLSIFDAFISASAHSRAICAATALAAPPR